MLTFPPIPPRNQRSVDTVNRLLRDQILPARLDRVTHIETRYKLAQSSSAELSLEGYLQPSSRINRFQPIYNPLQLERVGLAQTGLLVKKSGSPDGAC
jgi:hypothetical protein